MRPDLLDMWGRVSPGNGANPGLLRVLSVMWGKPLVDGAGFELWGPKIWYLFNKIR